MGIPRFEPERIPFLADALADSYTLEVDGREIEIGAVSMGNPHAVLQVEDLDAAPVRELGPLIERHPRFPQRVNSGFVQILDPEHVRLRVFERGAGETLACGTGACAAVAIGRRRGLLSARVLVTLPGGNLVVEWPDESRPVWITGPAATVYEGEIEL
jgi:diaminopimelate epimerase